MNMTSRWLILPVFLAATSLRADPKSGGFSPAELMKKTRDSVVTIHGSDRRGQRSGVGTGFFVSEDGLIVTNFHVIGRGRRFEVQVAGGKRFTPELVLAADRQADLAIVKIAATGFKPIQLGDSDKIEIGQRVVAIGNPLGYRLSVAEGIIAEEREIQNRKLIQVAMPIEPGNSGSPLLGSDGKVVGVISMKSGTTVGFAVPSNLVRELLSRPNPISMEHWATIGTLDASLWQPSMGGDWRQRAGELIASGMGSGFGGRMLLLNQHLPPAGAFDLSVEVKLDDESGAAGLVFSSDGAEQHYGFYPTAGSLRLTRFEGPDVFSWTILQTLPSSHYRPGDWNTIRVRVDGAKLSCYVNGELAIEQNDDGLAAGQVGLVKFREPGARFRRFRFDKQLPSDRIAQPERQKILDLAANSSSEATFPEKLVDQLAPSEVSYKVLRSEARALEKAAARLRRLSTAVHRKRIVAELKREMEQPEPQIDLVRAALLLSKHDNPELDLDPYLDQIARMAQRIRNSFESEESEQTRLKKLIDQFRSNYGFHGSQLDYYSRSNSYLNEVLDDREGLPITLSVVFMELARRLELPVVGLGVPNRFLVEFRPTEGARQIIDVFDRSTVLSREQAGALTESVISEDVEPATKNAIVLRMVRNLLGIAQREADVDSALAYLDLSVMLDDTDAVPRWMRAVLRSQTGHLQGALKDVDALLEQEPEAVNLQDVRRLQQWLLERL